jgi:ribosomal protein L11 methyltransferase
MDRILRFVVKQGCDVDEAWEELGIGGIEVLWSSESDEGADEIMAKDPLCRKREELLQQFSFLEEVVEDRLGEIDWVDQWETHGQGFKDGFIHLDVNDFGYETNEKSLLLQPGPGFGDLSHETTRLVLGMMAELVEGKEILDIGCGSGVLSLVAMRMGAVGVIGVDIDPLAIFLCRPYENVKNGRKI